MALQLSPLYPILDAGCLPRSISREALQARSSRPEEHGNLAPHPTWEQYLAAIVEALASAGVTMLQYRNKLDDDAQVLADATCLRRHAPASLRILLNDRAHLVKPSGCDGVHVGQTDLSPEQARLLVGPDSIVGLSTHDDDQVRAAHATTADYLAIGPVYATASKQDAELPVGLEGVRRARMLTAKPLVAIGGITLARAAGVRAAGADSLAVISALFGQAATITQPAGQLTKLAKDFLQVFR